MTKGTFNKRYFEILHKGKAQRSALKGPFRALRLCVLCILAPVMLIATPLYLRYHVYNEQVYPLGVSDMRLVDTSVSTMWCQKQIIRANTTFNAYLLSAHPDTQPDPVHISMTRKLVLSNDMKEYWGFYLLKGSIVTVSSCVRWPGASMVMIKGHKHLKECAYLGDNSSEEKSKQFEDESDNVEDANRPATMVKKKEGVIVSTNNVTLNDTHEVYNDEPFDLADLAITTKGGNNVHLRYAEEIRRRQLKKLRKDHHGDLKQELNNEKPKANKNQTSTEMFDEILNKLKKMGDKGTQMLEQLNKELANKTSEQNDEISKMQKKVEKLLKPSGHNSSRKQDNVEPALNANKTAGAVGTTERESESEKEGKKELSESVDDGGVDREDETNSNERKDEMKLRHDRSRKKRFRSAEEVGRMTRELHEDMGEEENVAEEVGVPRKMGHGIEYIRGRVNETTPNDSSKSEFWSSFSSSEERLMECEGLLLNLPLTPHRHCEPNYPHDTVLESNTVSYKIPSNGYYFFIYNSENEVQTNYLKIKFQLEKIVYNVSNAMASCTNETDACTLPLNFFSEQKVVLELPYNQNESTLNDEFLAISQCEPRTSLYLLCVVAVPVVIVMFAFQ
uniref:E3 ubiquitin-protein ligase APD1-4 middle domain-containing protein n=1 Tax=Cacopsylla melanoneura TaxID=428564 RepID=A0A8D8TT01_9HEMI